MNIITHHIEEKKWAEIISDKLLIAHAEDGADLMANMYYQGFDGLILNAKNFSDDFFNLKTGLAGEILQKFSNHQMRLIIIGDFKEHKSQSLNAFILESNKGKLVNFVQSIDEAFAQ